MDCLKNKKILFIGTGNMGSEVLVELVKRPDVDLNDVKVITGTSAGKDAPAIYNKLKESGIRELDNLLMFPHNEVTKEMVAEDFEKQDIVVVATKPDKVEESLNTFRRVIQSDTEIISIAAGLDEEYFQKTLNRKSKVACAMPHIPKAIYALKSDNEETLNTAKLICSGMGEPLKLAEDDDKFHNYTAIVGSGPGLIAYFISSFDNEQEQAQAIKWLKSFSKPEEATPDGAIDNITKGHCKKYYDNFLNFAKHYFGEEIAKTMVNTTFLQTVKSIEDKNISAKEYVERVRSARGVTNVALVIQGSPPPNDPKFGNSDELMAQNYWATEFIGGIKQPEKTIIEALVAATMRSKGIAVAPKDPLYRVDLDKVIKVGKEITATVKSK